MQEVRMDARRMYEMGLEAAEIEKLAIGQLPASAVLPWKWSKKGIARLRQKAVESAIKKGKKKGAKVGFGHLSGGKKVIGIGALLAAATGGYVARKKKEGAAP
jgi:hypothetical protein